MRKHISVIMLLFRCSIYKVLGLLAVMAALETGMYAYAIFAEAQSPLEAVLNISGPMAVFGIAFVALMIILCRAGGAYGSRTGYTLRRLLISERAVFWWQCAVNAACFVMLWAAQAAVLALACFMYRKAADPALLSVQTEFLAFYRVSFAHRILPMEEISRWICNGLLVFGLAAACAVYPYRNRRGDRASEAIAMGSTAIVCFARFGVVFCACMTAIVMAAVLWRVYSYEEGY